MSKKNQKFLLEWITDEEGDEEWLPGEQIPHKYYCNNKTELLKRYKQACTEGGYGFFVYVWCWNQYILSTIGDKWK